MSEPLAANPAPLVTVEGKWLDVDSGVTVSGEPRVVVVVRNEIAQASIAIDLATAERFRRVLATKIRQVKEQM